MPRVVYKLGTHNIRREVRSLSGPTQRNYVTVPILSRCVQRVGQLLQLDPATEDDLKVTYSIQTRPRSGGGEELERAIPFFRRGSSEAISIRLVYKQTQGETSRLKTLSIPIPKWAPNYKVLPVLFQKAQAAGLEVIGAYREGYLIPYVPQSGGSGGSGGGTGGGGTGGGGTGGGGTGGGGTGGGGTGGGGTGGDGTGGDGTGGN